MVKILAMLVVCGLLFAGGLAGSLYLRSQQAPLEETAQGSGAAVTPARPDGPAALSAPSAERPAELPVAVHGNPVSADEVFRFAASIRGREKALKERQEAVEQQEARLKMMQEDLRGQRRELEGLLGDLQDTLQRSSDVLEQVRQERQQLQQDKTAANRDLQEAEKLRAVYSEHERANIKKIAELLKDTDPEFAGEYIREEVNAGKLKTVVQVLAQIESRDAAKILQSVGDTKLVGELTDELLRLRPPPARAQR